MRMQGERVSGSEHSENTKNASQRRQHTLFGKDHHSQTSSSSTIATAATAAAHTAIGVKRINFPLRNRHLHLDVTLTLERLVIEPLDSTFGAVRILIAHRRIAFWQTCLLVLVDPNLLLTLIFTLALLDDANGPEEIQQPAVITR